MSLASQPPLFAREVGLPTRFALMAVFCLVLMVADARFQVMGYLRTGLASVLHPLQEHLTRPFLYLDDALEFFTRHGELLRDNQRLKAQVLSLTAGQQTMAGLRMENGQLRTLLGLLRPVGYTARPAEIIKVLPDPFNRKVIIDQGSRQGVQAGLPVADAQGLVGQVTRVFPASSEVTLIISRDQAAPVQVLRNGLRLMLSGVGNDRLLEVRFLDMHADVRVGDELVTSGLDGIFPPGIPVARVSSVRPPRDTPFAHAYCLPVSQVGAHRHVLVLRREPPQP